MLDVEAAFTYLDFVVERHRAWEARQRGENQPWCGDPIVNSRKFTNVFRVLDHGSQFVVTDLIEEDLDPVDLVTRLFLYRHTGRVETWDYLSVVLGEYPRRDNLEAVHEAWKEYRGATKVTQRGAEARNRPGTKNTFQRPLFTGAYLVFPQSAVPGTDKLDSIISLTRRLATEGVFAEFVAADTQAKRFQTLRRNKGVADFMSMQILTDYGYTRHAGEDREDEFVVAGPGAKRGAALIWPDAKPDQVIGWAQRAVHGLPDCPTVGGRKPSLMDIQNTLCEFSKYARYASRPSREQLYRPAHPGVQSSPVLPKHW